MPNKPVQAKPPEKVVKHREPSHLERPVTVNNIRKAEDRVRVTRNSVKNVAVYGKTYYKNYHTVVVNRTTVINNYYRQPHYRYYYNAYYRWGFYGGYYYPVRPCYDIGDYFWYPILYWLYVSDDDDTYYRRYYDYDVYYPVHSFPYARVYYPSDTIRDLGREVSAFPSKTQEMFRLAMIKLTESLAQQISDNLQSTFTLAENDIVVNHYENLQNEAIEMEGFVDRDDLHVSFKALIDLRDPDQTLVFVPTGSEPTDKDLYILKMINDRISQLGGNPYVADDEPTQSSSLD